MKSFLSVIMLCVFCACAKNVNQSVSASKKTPVIDYNDALLNWNKTAGPDIIDSLVVIPLETTEESLVAYPNQIVFSNDRIFILSTSRGNSDVLIFDRKGSFIKRLPTGNGPADVNNVNSIAYDEIRNELIVTQSNTIKVFSPDGEYKADYIVDFSNNSFTPLKSGNGYVSCRLPYPNYFENDNICTIYWIDTCMKVKKTIEIPNQKVNNILPNCFSYDRNGTINFSHIFDNNIYTIDDTGLSVRQIYDISSHEQTDPSIVKEFFTQAGYEKYSKEGKYIMLGGFCETNNYESCEFANPGLFRFFRNKNTNETYCRIGFFENSFLLVNGTYENFFVTAFTYDNYQKYDNKHNLFTPEQFSVFENFGEDDNPIIVLFSLK